MRTKTPRDIFERHLDLAPLRGRRRGLVRCIFHDDSTPSLSMDLDLGVFYCFGCGAAGGLKRFAELVGERPPSPPSAHDRRLPFEEARARVLAGVRRGRERMATYRPLLTISTHIYQCLRAAEEARQLATILGPGEASWDALGVAARVELEALIVEAVTDEILAGGRIA